MLVLSWNILTGLRAPWLLWGGIAIYITGCSNSPVTALAHAHFLLAQNSTSAYLEVRKADDGGQPPAGKPRSGADPIRYYLLLSSSLDHPSAFLPCICSLCRSALLLSPLLRFPCYVKTAQELALCLGEWMAIQGYGDR